MALSNFEQQMQVAGEHAFTVEGAAGRLEGRLLVPANRLPYVALLGHPHSLQGGTMQNKVVTTLARCFEQAGIASIRMNFRGVEGSQGVFDHGVGESEDLVDLAQTLLKSFPDTRWICAGFSFGSYVTARAACALAADVLISVAPPVTRFDFSACTPAPRNWTILQGDTDEVVSLQAVLDFAASHQPPLPVVRFPDTGHFFHGKLRELKQAVMTIVSETLKR